MNVRSLRLFSLTLAVLLFATATVSAQAAPWRVVQAGDGTLYLLKDGMRSPLVPSPISVVLSETSVVEPDIVYIAKDRLGIVGARGTIDGAPTLAIEVLSPSTARIDRQTKKQEGTTPQLSGKHTPAPR